MCLFPLRPICSIHVDQQVQHGEMELQYPMTSVDVFLLAIIIYKPHVALLMNSELFSLLFVFVVSCSASWVRTMVMMQTLLISGLQLSKTSQMSAFLCNLWRPLLCRASEYISMVSAVPHSMDL